MIKQTIAKKTIAAKFKRLVYFHGQLLTEQDLSEEQFYFIEKLKLHNRLHGKGVVHGLSIAPASPEGRSNWNDIKDKPFITIDRGFALDREGNEVIVSQPYDVDLTEYIDYLDRIGAIPKQEAQNSTTPLTKKGNCQNQASTPTTITIGVTYGECCSNPVTQYITTCSSDSNDQYSRIREGFRVVVRLEFDDAFVSPDISNGLQSASSPKCLGHDFDCEDEMIIWLARISIDSNTALTQLQITDLRYYAWTAMKVNHDWENARRELLLLHLNHNISVVIDHTIEEATAMLKTMKMTVETTYPKPSQLTESDLNSVRNAMSIVPEGSNITLVKDENSENVIFAFVSQATQTSGVRAKK